MKWSLGHWNNFLHLFYLLYYFFFETFIKNRSCCFLFRNSLTFKSGSSQVHYSSINFLQVIEKILLVTCCSISIMALLLLLYLQHRANGRPKNLNWKKVHLRFLAVLHLLSYIIILKKYFRILYFRFLHTYPLL